MQIGLYKKYKVNSQINKFNLIKYYMDLLATKVQL